MKNLVLTPWFDGMLHKPVNIGVYMQVSCSNVGYQKWDGVGWGPWCTNPEEAAQTHAGDYAVGFYQHDDWRGVLKAPNAPASSDTFEPGVT